ncbi:MAG: pilus assembly protein TadG-related protein [Chloroflexia bacterium]
MALIRRNKSDAWWLGRRPAPSHLVTILRSNIQKSTRPARGQLLVILAMLQLALLGIVGLSVDTAYFFSEKRALQGAADLAALVGSTELPDSSTLASTAALANATRNGYTDGVAGDDVAVVTPYNGEATNIEVTVKHAVEPYFLKAFGCGSINVSARAVAIHQAKHYAVFAGSTDCRSGVNAMTFSGSRISISGGDVPPTPGSNYLPDITPTAPSHTFATATVDRAIRRLGSNCDLNQAVPNDVSESDFSCTYSRAGDFDLNSSACHWVDRSPSSRKLKPGVYCATGKTHSWIRHKRERDVHHRR